MLKLKKNSEGITSIHFANNAPVVELRPGTITELLGYPGVDKTQLCHRIIVQELLMNQDAASVYISTTGSFMPETCVDLISDTISGVKPIASVMNRIKSIDVQDINELIGSVHTVAEFANTSKVSLLIIDNIFVPFKENFSSTAVIKFCSSLRKLAWKENFAIVFTNSYKTQIVNNKQLHVPYLGTIYALYLKTRVVLKKDKNGALIARIDKDL